MFKGETPLFLQKQFVHNYLICSPNIYILFKLLKIITNN